MYTLLGRVRPALHRELEVINILGLREQVQNAGLIGEALVRFVRQATLQAARVVLKWVRRVIALAVQQTQASRTQIDSHVHERSRCHTAAASPGGKVGGRIRAAINDDPIGGRVVQGCAIARERGLAPIEERRVGEACLGRLCPVLRLLSATASFRLIITPHAPSRAERQCSRTRYARPAHTTT